jgi:hypothetical protein
MRFSPFCAMDMSAASSLPPSMLTAPNQRPSMQIEHGVFISKVSPANIFIGNG